MNITSQKFIFWFGVWTTALLFIADYGVEKAPAIIAQFAPTAQWLAGFFGKLNMAIMTALTAASAGNNGVALIGPSSSTARSPFVVALLAIVFAFIMLVTPARAADIPLKTPQAKAVSFLDGYPSTSGFYFGINTEGGGGNAQANLGSVPGVAAASVTTNQIGLGATLGYVWSSPNGKAFLAAEGMFNVRNFNGDTPGLSFGGPASFQQRFKIGTPLNEFLSLFPNLGSLTIPPFPALPNGQVVSNIKPYIYGSVSEDKIEFATLAGSVSGWRVMPGFGVGALGQASAGVVVDVWAGMKFPAKGMCVGITLQDCGNLGTQFMAGLGAYY